MFKAIVRETEGTGAGYGFPPHTYFLPEPVPVTLEQHQ